jgi:hypothetical protein
MIHLLALRHQLNPGMPKRLVYQGEVERGSARTPDAIRSNDDPRATGDFSRDASSSQGGGSM